MREVLRRRLLWAAATDRTFERLTTAHGLVIQGRCIHCQRKLCLTATGEPISRATLEHIVPQTHGGGHDRDNLALACAGCNGHKGRRLDCRAWLDADLQSMVARLQQRRQERWRDPPEAWDLPPQPPGWTDG